MRVIFILIGLMAVYAFGYFTAWFCGRAKIEEMEERMRLIGRL